MLDFSRPSDVCENARGDTCFEKGHRTATSSFLSLFEGEQKSGLLLLLFGSSPSLLLLPLLLLFQGRLVSLAPQQLVRAARKAEEGEERKDGSVRRIIRRKPDLSPSPSPIPPPLHHFLTAPDGQDCGCGAGPPPRSPPPPRKYPLFLNEMASDKDIPISYRDLEDKMCIYINCAKSGQISLSRGVYRN